MTTVVARQWWRSEQTQSNQAARAVFTRMTQKPFPPTPAQNAGARKSTHHNKPASIRGGCKRAGVPSDPPPPHDEFRNSASPTSAPERGWKGALGPFTMIPMMR